MSNAGSKNARSYDKSVSNRAPKQAKTRPIDPATNDDPGAPQSTVAANTPSGTSKGEAGSSKKSAGHKSKEVPSDRRVVFRSTLDTPFRVDWPAIPSVDVKAFLDKFIELLTDAQVAKFNASRGRHTGRGVGGSNKTKKEADPAEPTDDAKSRKHKRKGKGREPDGPGDVASGPARKRQRVVEGDADAMATDPMPQPEILSHLIIGVNHVTKRLEGQLDVLSAAKRVIQPTTPHSPTAAPKLRYVLVCTGDIDPAALVAHIPHIVAGCNSNSTEGTTLLVPLPKGSEALLASALGLPRCSVVAIAESAPPNIVDALAALTVSFAIVRAPWLVVHAPRDGAEAMDVDSAPTLPSSQAVEHIPTHIKQVRTTAPRNMGAAKRARKEARAAVRAKLILHPTPEHLRKDMAGGKPVKKNRVVVVSLPEAEGTSS